MVFDILTIVPNIIKPYFREGIIKRAQDRKIIKINIHNIRDCANDKHQTVDDTPYGGGPGMVLKIDPIWRSIFRNQSLDYARDKRRKCRIVLLSPRGKIFNQSMAKRWSKLDHLILISGRYEGTDERVADYIADEIVSIGDYILMGGELAVMAIVETTSRLIPGVIGDEKKWPSGELAKTRKDEIKKRIMSFTEFPQYTKPEVFSPDQKKKWRVPKVLLSGDHAKIKEWRQRRTRVIT